MREIDRVGVERRERILAFIDRYNRERGFAPSFREVGDAVGLSSLHTIRHHLTLLQREGRVVWEPHTPRSLRVVTA